MIEARNIYKAYDDFLVLEDVNLTIQKNKITAIIGGNGVGKSTLLGVITRLLPMKQGEVYLDGVNLKNLKSVEIAKRIGILKQTNHIQAKITVYELVSYGRYPHSKGRLTKDDKEKISSAISYLDLEDIKDKYLDKLSGATSTRIHSDDFSSRSEYIFDEL